MRTSAPSWRPLFLALAGVLAACTGQGVPAAGGPSAGAGLGTLTLNVQWPRHVATIPNSATTVEADVFTAAYSPLASASVTRSGSSATLTVAAPAGTNETVRVKAFNGTTLVAQTSPDLAGVTVLQGQTTPLTATLAGTHPPTINVGVGGYVNNGGPGAVVAVFGTDLDYLNSGSPNSPLTFSGSLATGSYSATLNLARNGGLNPSQQATFSVPATSGSFPGDTTYNLVLTSDGVSGPAVPFTVIGTFSVSPYPVNPTASTGDKTITITATNGATTPTCLNWSWQSSLTGVTSGYTDGFSPALIGNNYSASVTHAASVTFHALQLGGTGTGNIVVTTGNLSCTIPVTIN